MKNEEKKDKTFVVDVHKDDEVETWELEAQSKEEATQMVLDELEITITEKKMGEIAEAMISGELCECCGQPLDCEECAEMGIPMYCSKQCAKDRGASNEQVCEHEV